MGGRGASSGGLGASSGKNINVVSELDVWSYRHNPNNEPFFEEIISGVRKIENDFPGIMSETVASVNAATLAGADKNNTLGYYSSSDKSVSLNTNYTDVDKMNYVYDASVSAGYHPPRGNTSGTEAVALHEMGHALTDHVAKKMGAKDLDAAAKTIVDNAYKGSGGRGATSKKWAGNISGYATESYAECVAEAVADYYCNGNKAKPQSTAIMNELRKYR